MALFLDVVQLHTRAGSSSSQSSWFSLTNFASMLLIVRFIRSVRLKKAAQLLLSTDCSISEAADLAGFNSIKYFNIHFKEEFGMTPTRFRETQKG